MRSLPAVTLLILAILASGCKKSPPSNVAATVNDRAITYAELDKQYEAQLGGGERAGGDQLMIQKLEVLRSLIDNEIMLQRAEKLGLMAQDSDVEAKFNELKAPYTQEEFQRQIQARKLSVDELKAQLRRDLSIQKLFNKEVTSKISISDKDIADFFNANKASFNLPEPQIHVAQIFVTPQPVTNVRNLKRDKAQNEDQARKKITLLEARIRQGDDFGMLAQNFSEDSETAPNSGDMGYIPESALEKTHPDIRKTVLSLQPGQWRTVHTQEGYRILKVLSREPAGQRELNDPTVQQNIRETLLNRKDQLLKAAYYEVARNESKVVNFLAAGVIGQEKKR